jgi:hypothetical protein
MKFISQLPFSPPKFVFLVVALGIGAACLSWAVLFSSRTFDKNHNPDPSNLRMIGQASLIYAQGHQDTYASTTAKDVWELAQLLANEAGLIECRIWSSRLDPAHDANLRFESILLPQEPTQDGRPARINPEFLKVKPSVAVALGPFSDTAPDSTPIAWTRGLKADGTWSADSPYGGQGGYIVFKDASVRTFHNLHDDGGQLMRFDGQGKTANIFEALPPGSRISEYKPTPEEQKAWAKASRTLDFFGRN